MTASTADLATALKEKFPGLTPRASADHPAFNIPAADVVALLAHLRDAHGYDMLIDLTAIDWAAGASPRFTVVYHLLSTTTAQYVRIAADCVSSDEPTMPTVVPLWAGANWHERECFDMFGITFTEHPDLRRILMWDGYPYHPLRKEFPLAGLETELPDSEVAAATGTKVKPAPMAGGPFVASPDGTVRRSEPRAKDQSWNEQQEKPTS